jgi:hypothetical protein
MKLIPKIQGPTKTEDIQHSYAYLKYVTHSQLTDNLTRRGHEHLSTLTF